MTFAVAQQYDANSVIAIQFHTAINIILTKASDK